MITEEEEVELLKCMRFVDRSRQNEADMQNIPGLKEQINLLKIYLEKIFSDLTEAEKDKILERYQAEIGTLYIL